MCARISSGRLRPVALEPRHQVGAIRIQREGPGRDAFALEHLLEIVDRQGFVAGRGVDPYQGPVALQDLRPELRPIDGLTCGGHLPPQRTEGNHRDRESQKPLHRAPLAPAVLCRADVNWKEREMWQGAACFVNEGASQSTLEVPANCYRERRISGGKIDRLLTTS